MAGGNGKSVQQIDDKKVNKIKDPTDAARRRLFREIDQTHLATLELMKLLYRLQSELR